MNYETYTDLDGQEHIIITFEDGSGKSIPAKESNPEYVAFLESVNDNTVEAE